MASSSLALSHTPTSAASPGKPRPSIRTMAELKQFHSKLIRLGLSADNHAMTGLINFTALSKSGDLNYALQLFDHIPHPDTFIYNTIIKAYLQAQLTHNCILLYSQMLRQFVLPNNFTFPSVIKACCISSAIQEGKQLHAHVFKFGFADNVVSQNNLIHMYINFQYLDHAKRVFDTMPRRSVVSWTTLVTGYSRFGLVDEAYQVFKMMQERNSVSWNAMMSGYVRSNRFREAFALFDRMWVEKVDLDKFVAASMLSACTGLGALERGEWLHGYIERSGMELDSKLSTAIIDMYCKCGCVEKALALFVRLPDKGISTWNCMIGGLAMHGEGESAIELFHEMEREKVYPDGITFVNLLTACSHAGLVEKGHYYFEYMRRVHGIEPSMEHFGCMVDLLGRSGLLAEAKRVIDEMPMSPDACVMGAFVGACKIHGEIELGEEMGKNVIELDPHNSGRYVILANLYAKVGRWDDVSKVRKLMDERGVKKSAGFSVIELDGVVNEFIAGDRDHPDANEIYAKLDEMMECVGCVGYIPVTDEVMHEFDKEEKENPLHCHSEKLAIAFGLLKTKPGATIRISKNLRVCRDCHLASKFISRIFDRQIIVRDRNRFHHFREGSCSCNDYW